MNGGNDSFDAARADSITSMALSPSLRDLGRRFMHETLYCQYTYHFDWLGRPIIQFPQDIVAFQEVVWQTKPDLIIETGIARGGSLILSASLLALLDLCDAAIARRPCDPREPKRKVLGIDIDIRSHNREHIERHPLASRIHMIEGSSVAADIVKETTRIAALYERVMVCLDSDHTHEHVLGELQAYAPLVSDGCYCIVWDTAIADAPKELFPDRPWGPGNNPKTAVHAFLSSHPEFTIDSTIPDKLLISVAPDGYLRRREAPLEQK